MKRNFMIALVLSIISFIGLAAAIVLQVREINDYCTYTGMASTVVAFFAVLFGINSWKER